MSGKLREMLRGETHDDHVRLHHHPLLAGLVNEGYRLADYRLILAAYLPVYRWLEGQVLDGLRRHGDPFDYASRRKLPWLQQDLAFLGADPGADGIGAFAQPAPAINPTDAEAQSIGTLIGQLYVLEGATLGGQLISRRLERYLGLTPETGARFFFGYGVQTAGRWEEFLEFSGRMALDEIASRQACESAWETFGLVKRALDAACALRAQTDACLDAWSDR